MISSLVAHSSVISRCNPWRYREFATVGIKVIDGPYQAIRVFAGSDWIERPPFVECAGIPTWLRSGADWHADGRSGYLCYEFENHWTQHFGDLKATGKVPIQVLEDLAAQWIVAATSFLLYIHYRCEQTGRKDWPRTVHYWDHVRSEALDQLQKVNSVHLTI